MDILQTILLAIVQGLTEFLPISSSAHLILPSQLFNIPDQGLSFDVAVHLGSLVAVMLFFRLQLTNIVIDGVKSLGGYRSADANMAWYIVFATIPAGIFGLLLNDFVEEQLRTTQVIAITTLLGALLLWYAVKRNQSLSTSKSLADMSIALAIIIGVAQALAIIPGTSRSGITITMALILGFTVTDSARFSFLMSVPIILLTGLLKSLDLLEQPTVDWLSLGTGFIISGITAYFCIHYFLKFIERIGMMPFIYYRLLLGIVLLTIVYYSA